MDGRDTSKAALARQREAFRHMTPERRLALAAEMTDEILAIAESGIRARHPDYSDDEVRAALAEMLLAARDDIARRRSRRTPSTR